MPRPSESRDRQINCRFPGSFMERLDAYLDAFERVHGVRQTMTNFFERAGNEFLDLNEPKVGIKAPKKRPSR